MHQQPYPAQPQPRPGQKGGAKTGLIVTIAVVAVLALCCGGTALAGIFSDEEPKATPATASAVPNSAPATSTSPAPQYSPWSPPASRMNVPGLVYPETAAQTAFLTDVQAIDPGLVSKPARTVTWGRDACLELHKETRELAVRRATQRLMSGKPITTDVATRFVAAAHRHFCPSFPQR